MRETDARNPLGTRSAERDSVTKSLNPPTPVSQTQGLVHGPNDDAADDDQVLVGRVQLWVPDTDYGRGSLSGRFRTTPTLWYPLHPRATPELH